MIRNTKRRPGTGRSALRERSNHSDAASWGRVATLLAAQASLPFVRAAIEAMASMREWDGMLRVTVQKQSPEERVSLSDTCLDKGNACIPAG